MDKCNLQEKNEVWEEEHTFGFAHIEFKYFRDIHVRIASKCLGF